MKKVTNIDVKKYEHAKKKGVEITKEEAEKVVMLQKLSE